MTALAYWLILAFAVLVTAAGRAWWGHIDENRRLRADVAERDAEIDLLKTFIDQQADSHAASAAEWADRCRAAKRRRHRPRPVLDREDVMTDLLIALGVLALLADVLWVNARLVAQQNRNDRVELDRWTSTRGRPIPLAAEPQLALPAITAPTTWDLDAWLFATDDAPIIWQALPDPTKPPAGRDITAGELHRLVYPEEVPA